MAEDPERRLKKASEGDTPQADRASARLFFGPSADSICAPVLDKTTQCRFRNALVKSGVYDAVPGDVCRRIEDHGLKLQEAEIL